MLIRMKWIRDFEAPHPRAYRGQCEPMMAGFGKMLLFARRHVRRRLDHLLDLVQGVLT